MYLTQPLQTLLLDLAAGWEIVALDPLSRQAQLDNPLQDEPSCTSRFHPLAAVQQLVQRGLLAPEFASVTPNYHLTPEGRRLAQQLQAGSGSPYQVTRR